MNKERFQWLAIALLAVGLVGVGAVVWIQCVELRNVSGTLSALSGQIQHFSQKLPGVSTEQQATKGEKEYKVVTQKTVLLKSGGVQFIHRCKGEIQEGVYCIGENQLVYSDSPSHVMMLKTAEVSIKDDAPELYAAELVPSTNREGGMILVSYSKDTCVTNDDSSCGAGMPDNFVTNAYSLGDTDHPFVEIKNYPSYGRPFWNPSGTRAVFIPITTCGGAGCDAEVLTGYDLFADIAKPVTEVKAAGLENVGAESRLGPLPRWESVIWKNDTDFSATIIEVNGAKKQVTGTFSSSKSR